MKSLVNEYRRLICHVFLNVDLQVVPIIIIAVVAYKTGTNEIGTWVTESGARIGTTYAGYMDIAIIRLSDWALIEEHHIYAFRSNNRLGKGDKNDTYEISLYDDDVYHYLNGLFNH